MHITTVTHTHKFQAGDTIIGRYGWEKVGSLSPTELKEHTIIAVEPTTEGLRYRYESGAFDWVDEVDSSDFVLREVPSTPPTRFTTFIVSVNLPDDMDARRKALAALRDAAFNFEGVGEVHATYEYKLDRDSDADWEDRVLYAARLGRASVSADGAEGQS